MLACRGKRIEEGGFEAAASGKAEESAFIGHDKTSVPTSGPRLPGEKIITCDYRVRYPCYSPNAGQNDGVGYLRADSADQGKNIGQALVMSGMMMSSPGWPSSSFMSSSASQRWQPE